MMEADLAHTQLKHLGVSDDHIYKPAQTYKCHSGYNMNRRFDPVFQKPRTRGHKIENSVA